LDKNKIFLINWGELEGRFDAPYYSNRTFYKIKTIKLKYIAKVKGGKRIPKGKSYSQKITNFKYLRVDDIDSDGNIDINSLKSISEDLYLSLKRYEVFENEIIISNAGTIGKIAILKQNNKHIILTENAVKLIKIDNSLYDAYLRIILNTKFVQEQIKQEYIQTTIPKLSIERISNLNIPILEQEKQQQIIDIMDNAYKQKKQKEKKAQDILDSIDDYLLNELGIIFPEEPENTLENRTFQVEFKDVFNSRFDAMYNQTIYSEIEYLLKRSKYPLIFLYEVCIAIRGVTYSANDEAKTGIGVLRGNNINFETNELDLSDIRYLNRNTTLKQEQKLCQNDILMSAASGSKEHVGKVAFIEQNLEYFFGAFMMVLRVTDKKIDPYYLFVYLKSKLFRKLLMRILGGTNINNLNFNMIKKFQIPLPDIDFQETMVIEIKYRHKKIKQLQQEAIKVVENAKKEVEKIILGDSYES